MCVHFVLDYAAFGYCLWSVSDPLGLPPPRQLAASESVTRDKRSHRDLLCESQQAGITGSQMFGYYCLSQAFAGLYIHLIFMCAPPPPPRLHSSKWDGREFASLDVFGLNLDDTMTHFP